MTTKPLDVAATLDTGSGTASYVSLVKLAAGTGADVARLPHTVKILLENIARRVGRPGRLGSGCRVAGPVAERRRRLHRVHARTSA